MQMNNVKFRKPVVPGDQLYLEVEFITKRSKIFVMKGKAFVNDKLVAEAEFMAGVVDRDSQLDS
jgi:3-hydroxymyristoyl/3-hydroxydecanoyl-(acyl carrier protein) dehydratase